MNNSRVFPSKSSPYWLEATLEIRQVLKALAKRSKKVTVHPVEADAFVTLLLDVTERGDIILDAALHEKLNAAAAGSQGVRVHGEIDRINIDFALTHGTSVSYGGSPALLFPAPTRLHKLQRREFPRLPTPMGKPLTCSLRQGTGDYTITLQEHFAQVLDISLGGVCIQYPASISIKQGEVFKGCALSLFEEEVRFDLIVRHTFEVENRLGRTSCRAGCQFIDLSMSGQQSVQRFMSKLERNHRSTLA